MRCGRRVVAVAMVVVGGVGFGPARPATASCPVATIAVEPATAPSGGMITVSGRDFGTACNDTVVNGEVKPPLGDPAKGIELLVRQDGRDVPLVIVAAAPDYTFAVTVGLPADLHDGPATVHVPGGPGAAEAAVVIAGVATDATAAPRATRGALSERSTTTTVVVDPAPPSGDGSASVALIWLVVIVALGAAAALAVALRGRGRGQGRTIG